MSKQHLRDDDRIEPALVPVLVIPQLAQALNSLSYQQQQCLVELFEEDFAADLASAAMSENDFNTQLKKEGQNP